MSTTASTDPSTHRPPRAVRVKWVLAAVLGGLAVVFAALNFDEVQVDWIIGESSTPLVVVIAASFLLGAACGLLLATRRGHRSR